MQVEGLGSRVEILKLIHGRLRDLNRELLRLLACLWDFRFFALGCFRLTGLGVEGLGFRI